VHELIDKCKLVYVEDLTFQGNSNYNKRNNRLLSGWQKGVFIDSLEHIANSRGSTIKYVNAAYTSQMDSKTHRLEGKRKGKLFHHADGTTSCADCNASGNIFHRGECDTGITRYMTAEEVKKILLKRMSDS